MANNRPRASLSSRDPTNKPIAVRLPSDLLAAIEAACEEHGITQSEFIRGLISEWAYGKTQLSGPDEGYSQARSMAAQLAHLAVTQAINNLPASHEEALGMLQGAYGNRKKR